MRRDFQAAHRTRAPQPIMSLALSRDGSASLVSAVGEIDMSNAHLLTEMVEFLCRPPVPLIALDLSAVRFFGAHGISALLRASTLATSVGARLIVRDPSPFVLRVLGVTGMARHLDLDVSSTSAVAPVSDGVPRPASRDPLTRPPVGVPARLPVWAKSSASTFSA
ncbi:anti-sigma factor antagonist [Micromonospora acroterricola]|uniref:Anti-sigma factor antagonist n=1 Tax=Micromonospora acroterricola TaxID=2202421 RepID=A0A317CVB8_9ACTN|nr:STAS domain-containing protein [Micromonospora acroterricola]PWR06508.1 anti-sigma factor antagonist [Micromonospora acroterricola]